MRKVLFLLTLILTSFILVSCSYFDLQRYSEYLFKPNVEWSDQDGFISVVIQGDNDTEGFGKVKITDEYTIASGSFSGHHYNLDFYVEDPISTTDDYATAEYIISFSYKIIRNGQKVETSKIRLEALRVTINNVYYEEFSTTIYRRDLKYSEIDPQAYTSCVWEQAVPNISLKTDFHRFNYTKILYGYIIANDASKVDVVFYFKENKSFDIYIEGTDTLVVSGTYIMNPDDYLEMILTLTYDEIFNFQYENIVLSHREKSYEDYD
jgi:hypothetical protein